MHGVQKVGLYLLLGLLAFSALFALLPARESVAAKTGATLKEVQLTLYPMQDPDAVWQFGAASVTNDPITGTTELKQLSQGERLLREKDSTGRYTGQETLDTTLSTDHLTIDGQDNLLMQKAHLRLVKHCAEIEMEGTPDNPIRIDQGVGFSVPVAEMTSPNINGHLEKLQMTFDSVFKDADPDKSSFSYDLNGTVRCVNGQRVNQGS